MPHSVRLKLFYVETGKKLEHWDTDLRTESGHWDIDLRANVRETEREGSANSN